LQAEHKHAAKVPKHEQRKAARARRAAEWETFMKTKPDDDYINADDEAAIKNAEANMGDFKLKSDRAYVPPEGDRVTAARKKQQARAWRTVDLLAACA
jgi:hypothetical protein